VVLSLPEAAEQGVGRRDVVKGVGNLGRVAEPLADLERALVVGERLRVLAALVIDGAEVVE
jgi:hypothetical protein